MMRCIMIATIALMLAACVSTGSVSRPTDFKQASQTNMQLAAGYLEEGNYEVALSKAQSAVEQDPTNQQAQSVLAVIYEQLGQSDKAELHYRKAIEINPENGDVQNNYGTFLCQRQRFDEAEKHFLVASEDPFYRTPEVALTNAGACARRKGDEAEAERLFREALAIRADYAEALFHLASMSYQSKDFFRARAFLQRYESAGPESPASLLLGYEIETALADADASSGYRQRLMMRFPNSTQAQMVEVSDPDDG